jgi:hypothetical protein
MSPEAVQILLQRFDLLPNDAIVPDPVAAAVLTIGLSTLKRKNPVPVRHISERRQGRRVGDLRDLMRGIPVTENRRIEPAGRAKARKASATTSDSAA